MKKNILEEDEQIKKGITKNLLYFCISALISLLSSYTAPIFSIIRAGFADNDVLILILSNYVSRLLLSLPSVAAPIVTVATLKPVRFALRQLFTKLFCCQRESEPQPEAGETETVPTSNINNTVLQ